MLLRPVQACHDSGEPSAAAGADPADRSEAGLIGVGVGVDVDVDAEPLSHAVQPSATAPATATLSMAMVTPVTPGAPCAPVFPGWIRPRRITTQG